LLPVAKEGNVPYSSLDIGEVTAAQQNPLAGILHLVQPGFLNTAEIRDRISKNHLNEVKDFWQLTIHT
jgi:hypothetical protein